LTRSADLGAGQRYAELEIADEDLSGTRLEGATFLSCQFRSIEADVARWRGVSARLTTFARCRSTDLRGSSLEDLDGAGGLAGATIDAVQLMELAPALAHHIGLRVDG
jgi:uncharacterized protein YjbI with pentapeptide repeats